MPRWLARALSRPELVLLTTLSALTRFWHLFWPRAVLFDEFHYERFASAYLTGRFYFDVNPPLGNLMYAGLAALLHIPADLLARPEPAPLLRILPAAIGTIVAPLVYTILRQLGSSRRVSALGAIAVLLDNALVVASRIVFLDTIMIGFGLGAIAAYLAARRRTDVSRMGFLAASAALAGCALSVKWSGASAIGLILATWAAESVWRRVPPLRFVGEGALLVGVPGLVYLGTFALHFALLPRSGPGNPFMSPDFQSQLVGSLTYDPAVRMPLWLKLADAHRAMWYGNRSLKGVTHPAASAWYTWPIMQHPFGLWAVASGDGEVRRTIMLVGNPVVWWGGVIAAALGLAAFATRPFYPAAFLLGGIAINYLPFAAIHRVMYLYYYLFALVFVVMFASRSLGTTAGWARESSQWSALPRWRRALYWTSVLAILAGFLYVAPFTYGWPLSRGDWATRLSVLQPF